MNKVQFDIHLEKELIDELARLAEAKKMKVRTYTRLLLWEAVGKQKAILKQPTEAQPMNEERETTIAAQSGEMPATS